MICWWREKGSCRRGDIFDYHLLRGNLKLSKHWETVSFCFWELFKVSKADFPEEGRHVWDTFILPVINAGACMHCRRRPEILGARDLRTEWFWWTGMAYFENIKSNIRWLIDQMKICENQLPLWIKRLTLIFSVCLLWLVQKQQPSPAFDF